MEYGTLQMELLLATNAYPVGGVTVRIRNDLGVMIGAYKVNENGKTDVIRLEAPPRQNSLMPSERAVFSSYTVEAVLSDVYEPQIVRGVQIFSGVDAVLPLHLHFKGEASTDINRDIVIPPIFGLNERTTRMPLPDIESPEPYLTMVQIPEYIIVHLGTPSSNARNVRVPFIDYIKNVASSEIYPTWPLASLEANIYCQITFALNRVYTSFYRSKGYSFDITSSTTVDQKYIDGRDIFQSVADVTNRIFNIYARRAGFKEPYFTQYCNGTTVNCPGLSQWGTVPLAQAGKTALQILKEYYPNDLQLVECDDFTNTTETYPGSPLRKGSQGHNVLIMQTYLNRVSGNFPLIPKINPVDGTFGTSTENAVKAFQKTFNISADGVIGKATWYNTIKIYVAVKKLAELDSEGERFDIGLIPPTTVISPGSQGELVVELQFLLNYIAVFYDELTFVVEDGRYGKGLKNAVSAFQALFNLKTDGICGAGTWRKLYAVYHELKDNVQVEPDNPEEYPGALLQVGASGDDVLYMQQCLKKLSMAYPNIPGITPDGRFGEATKRAVVAFQSMFGLVPDGIIGRATWDRIVLEFNKLGSNPGVNYPGKPLRPGSSGPAVLQMQRYLNRIAVLFNTIPKQTEDGKYGPSMSNAVIAFQRLYGISADGVIGQQTWNAITKIHSELISGAINEFHGTTLRPGSAGMYVALMQEYLNTLSRYHPTISRQTVDGRYGNSMTNAVVSFQRRFNMSADGLVGRNTWNAIVAEYKEVTTRCENASCRGSSYPGSPLTVNTSGQNVALMQTYLNKLSDYYPNIRRYPVDGQFGKDMMCSVKAFQKLFGLKTDGAIEQSTWEAIEAKYLQLMTGTTGKEKKTAPLKPPTEFLEEATPIFANAQEDALDAFELPSLEENLMPMPMPYPYPGTALRMGASGKDVLYMQQCLNQIGQVYVNIKQQVMDGKFGPKMESIVIAFQQTFGLVDDGVIGRKTWDMVISLLMANPDMPKPYPGTALRMGTSGKDVSYMQMRLNVLAGYYVALQTLLVDSKFGEKTEQNVKVFQRLFGLRIDGVIGQVTWNRIVETSFYAEAGNVVAPNEVLTFPAMPAEFANMDKETLNRFQTFMMIKYLLEQ